MKTYVCSVNGNSSHHLHFRLEVGDFLPKMLLNEMERLFKQVVKAESQKKDAEFRALQSQINPHFLYNTLDTLQWKALEYDAFEVADMVNSLSRFFRISLSSGKEFISISDEVEHVRNYLEIQKIRYQNKINYSIQEDSLMDQYLVPKLILQPLVENSIYHGLKPKKQGGNINIGVSLADGYLFIEVVDNGVGMDKKDLKHLRNNLSKSIESEHYGLYNINERLRVTFGEKYKLEIESKVDCGTRVRLKIPIIDEEAECLE